MTPAPGSCLPLLFLCLPISAVRCCGAGSGVVSPACLPVSPSLCGQMPDAVTPAPGSCVSRSSPCPASYQMLWRWLRGCVSRLSPCVSAVGRQLAAWSCLPLVSLSQSLRSDARRWLQGGVSRLSPSLCSQMPDALVVCPASRLLPVSQSVQSDASCCDAGCGVVSCLPLVSLCPARSLRSDPRHGVVSCTCLPVSPSLRGQTPDAVTLAPGRVPRLSPSFSQTLVPVLRSDARCWDAGSGVVSPACLPVSPSLCGWLFV